MILEHAVLRVQSVDGETYESSVRRAFVHIESAEGCLGAEVRQQEEDPTVYLLLVRWRSLEDHAAFRAGPNYEPWRALTHRHFLEKPDVTHFHEPVDR